MVCWVRWFLVLLIACANGQPAAGSNGFRETRDCDSDGSGREPLAACLGSWDRESGAALIGGGLGLLLSLWAHVSAGQDHSRKYPESKRDHIDRNVLIFTLWRQFQRNRFWSCSGRQSSRTNLQENLKESGRGAAVGFRNQVCATCCCFGNSYRIGAVIGAGLLMKVSINFRQVDPGFRGEEL